MLARARLLATEHSTLTTTVADAYDLALAKKAGDLAPVAHALRTWEAAQASLDELNTLLADADVDAELRELAREEHASTAADVGRAAADLKTSLVPAHPFADFPCMVELRPGAGGSEAGIFAADLLRMYQAWCKRQGLRATLLKADYAAAAGADSVTEAVLEIESGGAYGRLRCEAGVHRVQRVPETETKGRTHTSAVSVLVLPVFPDNPADELGAAAFDDPNSDYYIDASEVRTDVMRSSGAGGQHVNTTESKVRLVHEPTNTVVEVSEERSQQKNRAKAWIILRAKLAQAKREAREEELASIRLNVVGVAKMGRGDKVRTYNWGQQRVTDHRSGMTVHNLDDVVAGGEILDEVMKSVRIWQSEQDLEALIAEEVAKEQGQGKEEKKGKKK